MDFQESEIVFAEKSLGSRKEIRYPKVDKRKSEKKKPKKSLVPMIIRDEFSGSSWIHHYLKSHLIHDDHENDEEIVPPHVIMERRITRKVAFSLCSGNGRSLKGRDLSEVRDSILRMTGFLES